jgi:hypothetical protein
LTLNREKRKLKEAKEDYQNIRRQAEDLKQQRKEIQREAGRYKGGERSKNTRGRLRNSFRLCHSTI